MAIKCNPASIRRPQSERSTHCRFIVLLVDDLDERRDWTGLTVQIDEQPENIKEMIYKTGVSFLEPRKSYYSSASGQKMVEKTNILIHTG